MQTSFKIIIYLALAYQFGCSETKSETIVESEHNGIVIPVVKLISETQSLTSTEWYGSGVVVKYAKLRRVRYFVITSAHVFIHEPSTKIAIVCGESVCGETKVNQAKPWIVDFMRDLALLEIEDDSSLPDSLTNAAVDLNVFLSLKENIKLTPGETLKLYGYTPQGEDLSISSGQLITHSSGNHGLPLITGILEIQNGKVRVGWSGGTVYSSNYPFPIATISSQSLRRKDPAVAYLATRSHLDDQQEEAESNFVDLAISWNSIRQWLQSTDFWEDSAIIGLDPRAQLAGTSAFDSDGLRFSQVGQCDYGKNVGGEGVGVGGMEVESGIPREPDNVKNKVDEHCLIEITRSESTGFPWPLSHSNWMRDLKQRIYTHPQEVYYAKQTVFDSKLHIFYGLTHFLKRIHTDHHEPHLKVRTETREQTANEHELMQAQSRCSKLLDTLLTGQAKIVVDRFSPTRLLLEDLKEGLVTRGSIEKIDSVLQSDLIDEIILIDSRLATDFFKQLSLTKDLLVQMNPSIEKYETMEIKK